MPSAARSTLASDRSQVRQPAPLALQRRVHPVSFDVKPERWLPLLSLPRKRQASARCRGRVIGGGASSEQGGWRRDVGGGKVVWVRLQRVRVLL